MTMRDVYIIGTGIHPWMGFSEQVFADFAAVAVDIAIPTVVLTAHVYVDAPA